MPEPAPKALTILAAAVAPAVADDVLFELVAVEAVLVVGVALDEVELPIVVAMGSPNSIIQVSARPLKTQVFYLR